MNALTQAALVSAVACLAAAVIALATTPLAARFALRVGAVDEPNHRRVNVTPTPRGGGLAVAFAFVLVAGLFTGISRSGAVVPALADVPTSQVVAVFAIAVLAMVVGLVDDVLQIRARWQLLGQLLVAGLALAAGLVVTRMNNPFGPGAIVFGDPWAAAFTMLWIVGMINSINFIDGLDGLSTGVALIAAVTLGLISLVVVPQPFVGVLCFTLAGALIGFLRWNFHPATLFIGTSGVMFVGFLLAVLSILGTAKVVVALLVLGVPIVDTFWIIVRRLAVGQSPFTPDRGHIHHRLLDVGLSHRQTVVAIYAICLVLAALSLLLAGRDQPYAFLSVAGILGFIALVLTRFSTRAALEADLDEDEAERTAENGAAQERGSAE
jgi:UDP-GlcNAc:undecaprenyl-phosphate GlcNAc-1-phosphate transferase